MTRRLMIERIQQFFDEGKWNYRCDEKKAIFRAMVKMNSPLGMLRVAILVKETYYLVYAIFGATADESQRQRVGEYLHRANLGLINGNFEFSFEDGEIRYKTYVNFAGDNTELSDKVIEDSIVIPIAMFNLYGKNLIRLMLGESDPKKLVDEVKEEKKKEREARGAKSDS